MTDLGRKLIHDVLSHGEKTLLTLMVNVNPGLINHGLLIRGYSSNSHNLILKWYPPN